MENLSELIKANRNSMPSKFNDYTDEQIVGAINGIIEGEGTPSQKLEKLDYVLGTFGVEGFNIEGNSVEYLNAGDTYATTICLVNGTFQVTTWGDVVEKIEQQYIEDTPCDFPGTITSGTLRIDDLIDAFETFLDSQNIEYKKEDFWETEEDKAWYLDEVLVPELEYLAPKGWYFGGHIGDGTDFGYWRVESN